MQSLFNFKKKSIAIGDFAKSLTFIKYNFISFLKNKKKINKITCILIFVKLYLSSNCFNETNL